MMLPAVPQDHIYPDPCDQRRATHLASFNGSQLWGIAVLLFLIRLIHCAFVTRSAITFLGFLPLAPAPPEVLLEALTQHLSAAQPVTPAEQRTPP